MGPIRQIVVRRTCPRGCATAPFPRWDRNPNTGEGPDSARTEIARQRIFHDPEHPSHVTLTVADG